MNRRARNAARSRRGLVVALLAAVAVGVAIDRLTRPPVAGPPAERADAAPQAADDEHAPPTSWSVETPPAAAPPRPAPARATDDPVQHAFGHGVTLLQQGDHAAAAEVFHGLVAERPDLPEAHVNLGFALLGAGRAEAARIAFHNAIDLRPTQVNAYWGLAVTLEALGDLPGAMGAMRSYVHLTDADDPHVRRARSALWEWEEALARQRAAAASAEADGPGADTALGAPPAGDSIR